jgi:trehalose-6-phosphate synthase
VLSQFTGAAKELGGAVIINPYSIEEFADNLKAAIDMPVDERKKRMENMYEQIRENNVFKWASDIIHELTSIKKD